jgi:bla regulator protein BlaR1
VLTAVWLTGFITMMSFWCVQWRRISRLVRSATPLIEGREVDLLRKAERLARLPRSVPLLPSGNSMEPGVFGIIRPVLLWPEGIARHMDDAHLESVLAHEVCHVQRRDNLTSAIHMLVEAIFWFHPVVWWMERQLVKERERACDEAVLQLGNEAAVYAESILNVCKFFTESPTACMSGVMGSELKQRIARILSGQGERKLDLRRKAMLALACVLAVGVPLAAGFLRAAQGQTQPAQQNGIEKAASPGQVAGHGAHAGRPRSAHGAEDREGREGRFPLGPGPVFGVKGGLLQAKNQTLLGYIFFAFKPDMLQSQQFQAQLPGWVKATNYDIEARASGSPTKDDMRLMMQSLLEERFHLVIHLETREAPVYALVLAKPGTLGPRIKPHPADDPDCAKTKLTKTTTGHDATCGASSPIVPMTPDDFATAVYNMPMDAIAVELGRTAGLGRVSSLIGRRLVNRTGLTGSYDYMLEFAPEQELNAQPDASVDSEPGGPSFTAAVKNQLGLKLVPQKLPVEVIVVDHIERPSEN